MNAEADSLRLLGREFDGFDRALGRQLADAADGPCTYELVAIQDLEALVLSGDVIAAGVADVLMLNTDWLPQLIQQRKLLPLDPLIEELAPEGWPEAWVPSLRTLQLGPDGQTYGIAYHDGPMMLLYRTDLLSSETERAGFAERFGYPLRPAESWAELVDQAHWYNRPDEGLRGTILAGYPDEHNNVYDYLTQLWCRGGDVILDGSRSGLDSAAAQEAFLFLRQLWHASGVIDPAARTWDSVAAGVHFSQGEAALMVNWCGFASLSAAATSPTHGKIGCAPVPTAGGPDGRSVTMNSYWVLAVPSGCRDPRRAYRLIRSLTTSAMDRITALSGGTATRSDNWRRPDVQALAPYYARLEEAHGHARAVPRDPRWPKVAGVLNDMMAMLVEGPGDLSLLRSAHERVATILSTP